MGKNGENAAAEAARIASSSVSGRALLIGCVWGINP
jgi:hypothetical protein